MKRFILPFVLSLTGLQFHSYFNYTGQQPVPTIRKPALFFITAAGLITTPSNTTLLIKLRHPNTEKYNSPLDKLLGDH
jgi:hypothetical protein